MSLCVLCAVCEKRFNFVVWKMVSGCSSFTTVIVELRFHILGVDKLFSHLCGQAVMVNFIHRVWSGSGPFFHLCFSEIAVRSRVKR